MMAFLSLVAFLNSNNLFIPKFLLEKGIKKRWVNNSLWKATIYTKTAKIINN